MQVTQERIRDDFDALCNQTKEKYRDFEEKIKNVERKINKTVSTEYDFNSDALFKKFVEQNLDSDQMLDYIRHECLNLIIARKQFVKDSKARVKEERQKLKENKSAAKTKPHQPSERKIEEEMKDRSNNITE